MNPIFFPGMSECLVFGFHPKIEISPLLIGRQPTMQRSNVVLPHPEKFENFKMSLFKKINSDPNFKQFRQDDAYLMDREVRR